jgi:hypothetical protein
VKNLNVPANVQERNFFQNVLKRSQKINVNVQNSILNLIEIINYGAIFFDFVVVAFLIIFFLVIVCAVFDEEDGGGGG